MSKFILPKLFFKVEKWKWNSDYRVFVSNMGHFKNEYKQDLPIKINSHGYCMIRTYLGNKLAHRIVMLTWKPIPDAENLTVDHLDHNKRHNTLENLEWVTKVENQKRAIEDYIQITEPILVTKEDEKYIIKSGALSFVSLDEAAVWIKNHNGMKDASIKTIKKRITNAIGQNKLYCGRKWREEEIKNV